MFMKKLILIVLALSSLSGLAAEMKVSTLFFGDYYWNKHSDTAANNGLHGLALRRIYLNFDSLLDENHTAKVQLEANQKSPTATTTSCTTATPPVCTTVSDSSTMTPFIKQANVTRKIGDHNVAVGIVATPAWASVESSWGYRDVEKTPLDFLGWAGAVDGGVSVKGSFMEKMLMYQVLYGNGAKNNQETDKYKEMSGSLGVAPIKDLLVELFYDKKDSFKGLTDSNVKQLFVGYKLNGLRAGAQYAAYTLETQLAGVATADKKGTVMSAYAVKELSDSWSALARYDLVSYKTDASVTANSLYYLSTQTSAKKFNLIIVGADYKDGENFHIIPNIERVSYSSLTAAATSAGTAKPKAEEIVRVTFSFKF